MKFNLDQSIEFDANKGAVELQDWKQGFISGFPIRENGPYEIVDLGGRTWLRHEEHIRVPLCDFGGGL